MINLRLEKESPLTAQDRYDIISFAMEGADDNGFINSFVYERLIYCNLAIMLYPERKDEIAGLIAESPIKAWDTLIQDGTIETMYDEYKDVVETISAESATWYTEYADWAHSVRGILDVVQDFTGNIVQTAAQKLEDTSRETGVTELLEIAEDWGMTRLPTETKEAPDLPANSLFKE